MGNSEESGVTDTEIITEQNTPSQEQETPPPEQGEPFQLRGGSFTLMVLKLVDPTSESFFARISEKARLAPNFFRNAAVVLDLDGLPESQACDFGDIKARLRRCDLMVVGVQGGHRPHHEAALRSGLPLVPSGRPTRTSTRAAAPQVPPPRSTLVVSEVVRSGRQLYAPGGDLVVTAMVSPGAELLADGHIHVYGALRGRALAGLSGDTNARIFCMSLEAEMVSIAGLYQVNEDFDPAIVRKPVQIYLKEGYLCVESFAPVTR
jgi:septum site-determining protein MinC